MPGPRTWLINHHALILGGSPAAEPNCALSGMLGFQRDGKPAHRPSRLPAPIEMPFKSLWDTLLDSRETGRLQIYISLATRTLAMATSNSSSKTGLVRYAE